MKTALAFVGWMWLVYLVNLVIPYDLNQWGLIPRDAWGLVGIVTSPFLHGSIGHILSNTLPLIVMIGLLAATNLKAVEVLTECVLTAGGLLWLFGRSAIHIGASGLVYSLACYLVVAGWRSKNFLKLGAALLVLFLYSGLIWGILPFNSSISWDGHLLGAIGGIIVAIGQDTTKEKSQHDEPQEQD